MDPNLRDTLLFIEQVLTERLESFRPSKRARYSEPDIATSPGVSNPENPPNRIASDSRKEDTVGANEEGERQAGLRTGDFSALGAESDEEDPSIVPSAKLKKPKKERAAQERRKSGRRLIPIMLAQEAELNSYSQSEQDAASMAFEQVDELCNIEESQYTYSTAEKALTAHLYRVSFHGVGLSCGIHQKRRSASKIAKARAVFLLQRLLGVQTPKQLLHSLWEKTEEIISIIRTGNFQPNKNGSHYQSLAINQAPSGFDSDVAISKSIPSHDMSPSTRRGLHEQIPSDKQQLPEQAAADSKKSQDNTKHFADSQAHDPHSQRLKEISKPKSTKVTSPPPLALPQISISPSPVEILHWSPQKPSTSDCRIGTQTTSEIGVYEPAPRDQMTDSYPTPTSTILEKSDPAALHLTTSQLEPGSSSTPPLIISTFSPQESFQRPRASSTHIHTPQAYVPKTHHHLLKFSNDVSRDAHDTYHGIGSGVNGNPGQEFYELSDETRGQFGHIRVEDEEEPTLQVSPQNFEPTVGKVPTLKTPLVRLRRQVYFTQHRYLIDKASFREAHLKSGSWQAEVYLGKALFVCKAVSKEKRLAHIKAEMLACQTIGKRIIS